MKQNVRKIVIGLLVGKTLLKNTSYSIDPIMSGLTEADLEVGRNGKITEVVIADKKTGTGPFDNNDEAGNDSSPDNDIVRSYDQIIWEFEITTALKLLEN